ncbi:MAG TPA: cell surface protein SprA, partial [Acidobacteriota bacterium]|nr:cell surface protein SprA [Acidobacteriota bacterium]
DDVLDPNASVTVDYEYAPFMTVEKRSLFGFSTTYDGGENLRAGATLLYKGTKATDRPAQLGQEPFRDIVGEVFLNWHMDAPFLTGLADALPLITTETPSSLDFQSAVAQSFPNPNTKGVVYVDDFQGARRAQSLGILRETWTLASPPLAVPEFVTNEFRNNRGVASEGAFTGLSDPAVIWTNPYKQFLDTEIYARDSDRSTGSLRNMHVFIMEFRPNQSPTIAAAGDPGEAWGGVMRALPVHIWDQSRAEFIELRMAVVSRATGAERKGTLHLDLGRITEDVNGDGNFNTEDQEINGIRNQILDPGEDLGLDGLPDEEEIGPWGDSYDAQTNPDPARDNWPPEDVSSGTALSSHDRINGTQNNERDPVRGLRPDSEDIGGPSEFDRANAYYEFSIDLDNPVASLVPESGKRSDDRSGYTDGLTGQTYRIPLWDDAYFKRFFESGSSPDSSNAIEFARLWIDGADTTVRIYIAAIDIVARTWTADLVKADPPDSTGTFRLGVVNDEENLDYVSPPGVSGYEDPRSNFTETEQALLLEWADLSPGDVGTASISGVKEDYTGYRTMRMWVWADSLADSLADIALRFGQDTNNYYFYQNTLAYDPVHDNNWEANRIVIDFNELTALKDANRGKDYVYDSVSHLGVVGNPSLTNVTVKEIAVIPHGASNTSTYSGKVWCDELELVDPRKDAGIAASGKLTAQVADLVGFTAAIEAQNYSFRGLTAGRTNSLVGGSSRLRTSFNGNLNLHKFLPEKLGISLPFAANYSRSDATPRLLTGSDIVLTPERQEEEKSTTISHGFSTRFAMRPKEAGWLMRSTIGAFSTRFAGSRTRSWTPTTPLSEKENYSASADYQLQIGAPLTFPVLYWTRYLLFPQRIWRTPFSPLPSDFSASGTVRRQRSVTRNNRQLITRAYTRDFVGNAGFGLKPIPAMQVNYDMSTTRDLADPEQLVISTNPRDFRLGRETAYSQRLQTSYRPSLFSFFSPTFTYGANFRDNIDKQYGDHDVNVDRNWSVGGSFDPAKFWGALGAKAGKRGPRAQGGDQLPERYRQQMETPDADTTAAKKEQSKEQSKGGGGLGLGGIGSAWRLLMNGMKWLSSPFGTLSVNYTRGDGDVRRDLRVRPSRLYQFGFDLNEKVATAGSTANSSLAQQSSRSQRESINLKNNIDFLGILSFSNVYTRTTSKNTTAGSDSRKEGEVFPSLSTSLNRLERLKPLGWVFSSASMRFGYTRKTDLTFVGDKRDNKVTGENFSPLFSLRGTMRKGIQLDIVIDRTSTVSQPRMGSSTKSLTRQVRVTSSFSFASPNGIPIPFLRKLRFKSRLSLSISVTHRVTETFMALKDSTLADLPFGKPQQSNSDLSITVNGNYSFSTRVRGGLKLEWTDRTSRQKLGSQKSHVRVVSIWAEFSF